MAFDVIVVGGGIAGAASAYYLAKRGMETLLLDQGAVPNPLAPSADHAHAFRLTFGKDSFYSDLALKTVPLWRQFEQEAREELLLQSGMLDLAAGDGRYEQQSFDALKLMGVKAEKLAPADLGDQYRTIRARAFKFGVFHQDGGLVWSQRAVGAFAKAADKAGAEIHTGAKAVKVLRGKDGVEGIKDERGRTWKAARYVFACGPWTGEVLSSFGLPLKVTRQENLYLRPPRNQGRYRPAHFPVFSLHPKGVFGFPIHIHGFLKMSFLKPGAPCRTISEPPPPDKSLERKCRALLRQCMPDLADFSDLEGKSSYYTWTPDGDFLLDRLPGAANAWVAAGFAGLGPMFAPLIGTTVMQMVSGDKASVNLHRFRADRLRLKKR